MTILLLLLATWFTDAEQQAVSAWIRLNPKWTLAARDLCTDTDALARHEERVPGYHPFRARGDFNGDGFQDVAVVVSSGRRLALVVFHGTGNGTIDSRRAAFLPLHVDAARPYLFAPRGGELLVGGFETDVYFRLERARGAYRLVFNDSEEDR